MSFFVRENNISRKHKKVSVIVHHIKIKFINFLSQFTSIQKRNEKPKRKNDEELESEDEDVVNGNHKSYPEISDEEDTETPDAKRLRLAKQYLDEIRKSDDEEEEVTKKLKFDFLESIGKLKKFIAENVTGYDSENVSTLKHKLQGQPITCLCLLPNDKFLFSGSKSGNILKWDIENKRQVGCIPLKSHIMCIAITSDSKFLAISDRSNKIFIHDPETLKRLHTFEGHRAVVSGLAFRRETHQMFSCSEDRSVKVWSLDEMVYVETL